MKTLRWPKILGLSAALAVFLHVSGCGVEGPDVSESTSYFANNPTDSLHRDLSTSTLAVGWEDSALQTEGLKLNGQVAVFQAVGGTSPYTWSVNDAALGTIIDSREGSAVYQRSAKEAGENVVILTDATGSKAYATITQPEDLVTHRLAILWENDSLKSAGLTLDGQIAIFTASGGTAPYYWAISYKNRGSIIDKSATSAAYQRKAKEVGDNVVILTDSKGNKAYTVVSQPSETTGTFDLTITWADTALKSSGLKAKGDVAELQASGGSPPYVWHCQDPELGTIIQPSGLVGPIAIYQRNGDGDNVVWVQDKNGTGQTVYTIIHQPAVTTP